MHNKLFARLAAIVMAALIGLVAPVNAAVQLRFVPTPTGYALVPDTYTSVMPPMITGQRPGIDFRVGRTSTNPLKVGYDFSSAAFLVAISKTSFTPAKGLVQTLVIDGGIYPGDFSLNDNVAFTADDNPAVWLVGKVTGWDRASGTLVVTSPSDGFGKTCCYTSASISAFASDGNPHASWTMKLHLPNGFTSYATAVSATRPGVSMTVDTWTMATPAVSVTPPSMTDNYALSDWDFRNVYSQWVFNASNRMVAGKQLSCDQCLFETAGAPSVNNNYLYQFGQTNATQITPYSFTNSEWQFDFNKAVVGTTTLAEDTVPGSNTIKVTSLPPIVTANLPDYPPVNGSYAAPGNTYASGTQTYRKFYYGRIHVLDLDLPTNMAATHVLDVAADGQTLTLEYDKYPSDDHGNILISDSVATNQQGVSPIYKTMKAGDRIVFYTKPSIERLFTSRLVTLDHNRMAVPCDLYQGGIGTNGDGFGVTVTNNVIRGFGMSYAGYHGDLLFQSYGSTLGGATWTVANNIVYYDNIEGYTNTGTDVTRDLFLYYVNSPNDYQMVVRDNIFYGFPGTAATSTRASVVANNGTFPIYFVSSGLTPVVGTTQTANGNTRVYLTAINNSGAGSTGPNGKWVVNGMAGLTTDATPAKVVPPDSAAPIMALTSGGSYTLSAAAKQGDMSVTLSGSPSVGSLVSGAAGAIFGTATAVLNGVVTLSAPLTADVAAGATVWASSNYQDIAVPYVTNTGGFDVTVTAAVASGVAKIPVSDTSRVVKGMKVLNMPKPGAANFSMYVKDFDASSITLSTGLRGSLSSGTMLNILPAIAPYDSGAKKFFNNYFVTLGPSNVNRVTGTNLIYDSYPLASGVSFHDNYTFDATGKVSSPLNFDIVPPDNSPKVSNITAWQPELPAPTNVVVAPVANDNTKLQVTYAAAAGATGTQVTTDGATWKLLGADGVISGLAANTSYPVQLRSMAGVNNANEPVIDGPGSGVTYGRTGS